MFASDRIITLDIGASKLALAEFLAPKSGAPQLLNYGIGQLGVDAERETDASAYIVSTIREIMRERGIKPAPLLMTVSGQAVFPRYVKLPPVSRDKVMQIVSYEAEQNVPFPIDEVVWDYQLIEGDAEKELNVMLVAVKTESVTSLTDCVQAAGLEPQVVDVAPMALYNIARYSYPDLPGCTMVLDVGARSSNVIFVERNRIFSRSIPVAGNAITQELVKEFGISFVEADELKRTHAFVAFGGVYAGPDDDVADRVSKIVRNVITRLHAEVNRSINFYRSQQEGSVPSLVLLTGGSSIIPHMDTFFRDKLKVDVEALNPFINVMVSPTIDADRVGKDVHLLGEVTGLALRRSLVCPVELNLMPRHIVERHAFRKRQPFFALTAVGLVLIMLCWWAYSHRMSGIRDVQFKDIEQRISSLASVDGRLKDVLGRKNESLTRIERLQSLIDMRTQWLGMLDAIHACLLDGMWLWRVKPVVGDSGDVEYIEVEGRGFEDKLKRIDKPDATAIEHFCEQLRQNEHFTAQTKIIRQPPVSSDAYEREFTIWVALKQPIKVP